MKKIVFSILLFMALSYSPDTNLAYHHENEPPVSTDDKTERPGKIRWWHVELFRWKSGDSVTVRATIRGPSPYIIVINNKTVKKGQNKGTKLFNVSHTYLPKGNSKKYTVTLTTVGDSQQKVVPPSN